MAEEWKNEKPKGLFWRYWDSVKSVLLRTIYFWHYRTFIAGSERMDLYTYWNETMMLQVPLNNEIKD